MGTRRRFLRPSLANPFITSSVWGLSHGRGPTWDIAEDRNGRGSKGRGVKGRGYLRLPDQSVRMRVFQLMHHCLNCGSDLIRVWVPSPNHLRGTQVTVTPHTHIYITHHTHLNTVTHTYTHIHTHTHTHTHTPTHTSTHTQHIYTPHTNTNTHTHTPHTHIHTHTYIYTHILKYTHTTYTHHTH